MGCTVVHPHVGHVFLGLCILRIAATGNFFAFQFVDERMVVWVVTVTKIEGNEKYGGDGRMEIINAGPTNRRFTENARHRIGEHWGLWVHKSIF